MTVFSDDWGMCCDEEMARECARDYSQRKRQEKLETKKFIQGCLTGGFVTVGIIVLAFLLK